MPRQWQDARLDLGETLDRLFDKGVVVDPWARVGAAPIDLVRQDQRVIVASIEVPDLRC